MRAPEYDDPEDVRVSLTSWHTFFATQATVGAALTGLVFVALSINLEHILKLPGLAGRAAEALLLLLLPVLVGLAGALPQASLKSFGIEELVLGVGVWLIVTFIVISGRRASSARPTAEFLMRAVMAEAAVLPSVVAGVLLVANHPGGLWWQALGTALCIVTGVLDAWVLLVEILR